MPVRNQASNRIKAGTAECVFSYISPSSRATRQASGEFFTCSLAITVDDAPFYYATYGGEFEAKVKVSGDYKTRFDQAGMMLRIDPENYIKAVRRLDAVEVFYSFDDRNYTMMRNAWMQDNTPIMVGLMAACPDGNGFNAHFEHFTVKHLSDMRRTEWLKKNAE